MSKTFDLIEILCNAYPEFRLFWDTHFELIKEYPLTPVFDDKFNPEFPLSIKLVKKDLTLEDKIAFYKADSILWEEMLNAQREEGDSDQ